MDGASKRTDKKKRRKQKSNAFSIHLVQPIELSSYQFDKRLLCNTYDKIACFLRFRVCFSIQFLFAILHLNCIRANVYVCGTIAVHVNCKQMWFCIHIITLLLFFLSVSSILSFRFHLFSSSSSLHIYSTFALRFL